MITIPEEISLEDYTIILPSVAVGNVGQVCTDLLIYNLKLTKVGSLWNCIFLPICGLDPYDKNSHSLCTAADFYVGTKCKMIVLQLRSPYIGNVNDFFNELSQFVQLRKIKKIIILTSSYDYVRDLRSESNLRYLTSDESLLNNHVLLDSLGWKMHIKQNVTDPAEQSYIPGGGFANGLYKHFKLLEIPCTVLFRYCSEGDNVPDGIILFKGLNQWLRLIDVTTDDIKYPPSWEYFFGNPPTSEIY